ncbi:MAG: ADP-ribosylglycohydrolase family protein [Bacteroidota bacterium]
MNIHDLLIGTAIGDAFGAGVEFQDREWIRQQVDFGKLINARGQIAVPEVQKADFTRNYQPWDYTDDTEMTIGLIEALLSGADFTCELLVSEWEKEYRRGLAEKGYGRNGHGSMAWYYRGEKSLEAIRAFQRDRPNPGNAPVMRVVPLGLLPSHLINAYAQINAEATHPHPHAIMASQCVARAAEYMLVQKGEAQGIISYCRHSVELDRDFTHYLQTVEQLPAFPSFSDADWVCLCGPQPIESPYFLPGIHGLPSDAKFTTGCVLLVLKQSRDAFDALKQSIRIGGDVDSVASICTGIMAGRYGLQSLPDGMRSKVEGVEKLSELANRFSRFLDAGTSAK